MAQALGVETIRQTSRESAEGAVAAVGRLLEKLEIPRTLSAVGISGKHITTMVPHALGDVCLRQNPRSCSEDDIKRLYEVAL